MSEHVTDTGIRTERRTVHDADTGTDGSGRELGAALAATRRHDGAARTGPHPETEAVDTSPTTVVRLERPLALGHGQHSSSWWAPRGARSWSMKLLPSGRNDLAVFRQQALSTTSMGDRLRVLISSERVKLGSPDATSATAYDTRGRAGDVDGAAEQRPLPDDHDSV